MRIIVKFCLMLLILVATAAQAELPTFYTVKDKDNLSKIARNLSTPERSLTYDMIAKANTKTIKNPNVIYPKQVLLIPISNATRTASKTVAVKNAGVAKSNVARVSLHVVANKAITRDNAPTAQESVHANAPQISYLMSEVVVTVNGPAHVIVGLNTNRILPHAAIARLFPDASGDVSRELVSLVSADTHTATTLLVGDRMQHMLTAEGEVYDNVLQAQLDNVGLPAKCYASLDQTSGSAYLLIRDTHSGNWYGEKIPVTDDNTAPCSRNRSNTERRITTADVSTEEP